MKVGDLVKIVTFKSEPMAIITKADEINDSGDTLYWCEIIDDTHDCEWATTGYYHDKHLEVINASR